MARPVFTLVEAAAIQAAARELVTHGRVVLGENPLLGDLTAVMESAGLTDDQVAVSFQTEPRGVVLANWAA